MVNISKKQACSTAAALMVAGLAVSGGNAAPVHDLSKRMNIAAWGANLGNLIATVRDFLRDINAYDINVEDACKMTIATHNGGDCSVWVYCDNGQTSLAGQDEIGHVVNNKWNVCYKDGEQFMHDDGLGDFSVTFTKAGGVDGEKKDGLHHPVLKVAGINDWEPLDIQAVVDAQGDSRGGNLCKFKEDGQSQGLTWTCGIPRLGADSLFGMANYGPDDAEEGFEAGWCTAHISQYQRNEFGTGGKYAFDVIIKDNAGKQITSVTKKEVDDAGNLSITSRLPLTLELHSGGDDADAVSFSYGDQSWACDDNDGGDHLCTLGNGKENGYENGSRNGDMGWTC